MLKYIYDEKYKCVLYSDSPLWRNNCHVYIEDIEDIAETDDVAPVSYQFSYF